MRQNKVLFCPLYNKTGFLLWTFSLTIKLIVNLWMNCVSESTPTIKLFSFISMRLYYVHITMPVTACVQHSCLCLCWVTISAKAVGCLIRYSLSVYYIIHRSLIYQFFPLWISMICGQGGHWERNTQMEEVKLAQWKQPAFIPLWHLWSKHLHNSNHSLHLLNPATTSCCSTVGAIQWVKLIFICWDGWLGLSHLSNDERKIDHKCGTG